MRRNVLLWTWYSFVCLFFSFPYPWNSLSYSQQLNTTNPQQTDAIPVISHPPLSFRARRPLINSLPNGHCQPLQNAENGMSPVAYVVAGRCSLRSRSARWSCHLPQLRTRSGRPTRTAGFVVFTLRGALYRIASHQMDLGDPITNQRRGQERRGEERVDALRLQYD